MAMKIVYISVASVVVALSSGMTIIAMKTPIHLFLNHYAKSSSTFELFGGISIFHELNKTVLSESW